MKLLNRPYRNLAGRILLWILFCTSLSFGQEANLKITSRVHFDELASQPLYQKYGKVSSVKLIYHIEDKKIHFIPSKKYRFHFDYCRTHFEPFLTVDEFNQRNYSQVGDRNYFIGNLNYYESSNQYALEISSSVELNKAQVETFFHAIKNNIFYDIDLSFIVNTSAGLSLKDSLEIPILMPSAVYKNQKFQSIHQGIAYGKLVFVENQKQLDTIPTNSIVILNGSPVNLPLCKGIVTNTFQTPLSHIQILAKNRKMPSAAFKGNLSHLKELIGKEVELKITNDTLHISASNNVNGDTKTRKKIELKFNLNRKSLITPKNYKRSFSDAIGNKANNFMFLERNADRIGYKTPEHAFVIPFQWYEEHLHKINFYSILEKLDVETNKSIQIVWLDSIRNLIKTTKMSELHLAQIDSLIQTQNVYKRFRFRSSTNAEDAKGFSGAGLYDSKTGILGDTIKSIENAIRKVWASAWTPKAFFEREYFNIKQSDVKMGILAHRSFPNEEVNGVAITKNLYREDYYGFVLNCQKGDVSVVDQNDSLTAEQMIIYPKDLISQNGTQSTYDVITYSSLSQGKLLLTDAEIEKLAKILNQIQNQYQFGHSNFSSSFLGPSLDLEFKIDKSTRELYIKQIRPY